MDLVTQQAPGAGEPLPVTLTPKALDIVKQELKNEAPGAALRISVVGGGCSGFQYDLDFSTEQQPGDIVREQDGVTLILDERSSLYLQGTSIDYVEQIGGGAFKFMNPNAQKTCGCGTSFQV